MSGSSLAHTRWDCSYHIIFIPKFRRKVFFKEIRKEVGEILRTLCEYRMWSW
jgi:putative transposase